MTRPRRILQNNLPVVIGLAIALVLGSYLLYVMMFQGRVYYHFSLR